ncbi:MAG: hypothetical protein ABFD62_14795 [Syntrophaceae bacterium]
MKWIEVIKISIAENRRAALEHQIKSVIASLNNEERAETLKLYYNLLDGDLCIHLCWDNGDPESRGSKTGLCLAHLLREFGLISHSVWVEQET